MIKRALSKYKFVVIRGLNLEASALEELGSKFGQFADDPYLESLDNYEHVVEVRRDAPETTPIFGSDWHSDWSFQKKPRYIHSFMLKKSLLLAIQTTFADCVSAYDRLKPCEKIFFNDIRAKHSASESLRS